MADEVQIIVSETVDQVLVNVDEINESTEVIIQVDEVLGVNGLSAYEVAVQNGFVGTEEQWLLTLKSENIIDLTLPVSFDGQVQFNIFTQPTISEKHFLLINGVEYYHNDSYTIVDVSGSIKLNWLNEFNILTTMKLIFRKF